MGTPSFPSTQCDLNNPQDTYPIVLACASKMGIEEALSAELREKLRDDLVAADHEFVAELPKVELHVHIEGTITASLRWKLTQRNGTKLRIAKNGRELKTLEELEAAMDLLRPDSSRVNNDEERFQFFEAYYEGFECLKTQEDYFDLAIHYLEHAAKMNVRYCEIFFDPQGHTSRGISWDVMMGGFRDAQEKAERELNVCINIKPSTEVLLDMHAPSYVNN